MQTIGPGTRRFAFQSPVAINQPVRAWPSHPGTSSGISDGKLRGETRYFENFHSFINSGLLQRYRCTYLHLNTIFCSKLGLYLISFKSLKKAFERFLYKTRCVSSFMNILLDSLVVIRCCFRQEYSNFLIYNVIYIKSWILLRYCIQT